MPQGQAGRTAPCGTPEAQATGPSLAVPLPRPTAAGSPPRTSPFPDPAVPRGAPPVVPGGPKPVPSGPPPTHGVQGAAPMGGPTVGELPEDAAQEAAAAGPRDISELPPQALDAYRRAAAESEGAAPAAPGGGADVGKLIAQALAAVAPRTEEAKEEPSERVDSGDRIQGGEYRRRRHRRCAVGLWSPVGSVPERKEWRTGCEGGAIGARWHLVSRVRPDWRTAWTSMRAPAGPGCPTTCGHGWTR